MSGAMIPSGPTEPETTRRGEVLPPERRDARDAPPQMVVRTLKVTKIGALAAFLRPLGLCLGLAALLFLFMGLGTSYLRSMQRDAQYRDVVHQDNSVARLHGGRQLSDDDIPLIYRLENGELRQVLIERNELDKFLNQALGQLEQQRTEAKQAARESVEMVFDLAFADAEERVQAYADWFFAWKRSYVLLKETVGSAMSNAVSARVESLDEAITRDISDYFMRHFTDQVLRPEFRDPLIEESLHNALAQTHRHFLAAVANHDLRLQLFMQEHTDHLDTQPVTEQAEIELDWDAQRWRAPLHLMEDRGFDGVLGASTLAGSTAAGATAGRVLAPALALGVRQAFSRSAAQVAASAGGRAASTAAGAGAGSVAPGLGTALGAIGGFALGTLIDWFGNEANEHFSRDQFVEENRQALRAVRGTWQGTMQHGMDEVIDVWFDDLRSGLLQMPREQQDGMTDAGGV